MKSEEGTVQGDPIAMPVYAILILPVLMLIVPIEDIDGKAFGEDKPAGLKREGFADDLQAAGSIELLKFLWDQIIQVGPLFGYYPNPSKTWLIVKEEYLIRAEETFGTSGVKITSKGKRHLGAAIGSDDLKNEYVQQKVAEWVCELNKLSDIAMVEPHVAYSAYTHGI